MPMPRLIESHSELKESYDDAVAECGSAMLFARLPQDDEPGAAYAAVSEYRWYLPQDVVDAVRGANEPEELATKLAGLPA